MVVRVGTDKKEILKQEYVVFSVDIRLKNSDYLIKVTFKNGYKI